MGLTANEFHLEGLLVEWLVILFLERTVELGTVTADRALRFAIEQDKAETDVEGDARQGQSDLDNSFRQHDGRYAEIYDVDDDCGNYADSKDCRSDETTYGRRLGQIEVIIAFTHIIFLHITLKA